MKFLAVIALFFIVAFASASASVVPEVIFDGPVHEEDGRMIELEDVDTDGGLSTSTELSPIRHRRITCDLLSFSSKIPSVGSAACFGKCLSQGRKKGGSCRDGVCVCR